MSSRLKTRTRIAARSAPTTWRTTLQRRPFGSRMIGETKNLLTPEIETQPHNTSQLSCNISQVAISAEPHPAVNPRMMLKRNPSDPVQSLNSPQSPKLTSNNFPTQYKTKLRQLTPLTPNTYANSAEVNHPLPKLIINKLRNSSVNYNKNSLTGLEQQSQSINKLVKQPQLINSKTNYQIQASFFSKVVGTVKKGFDWVKERVVEPIKRKASQLLDGLKKEAQSFIDKLQSGAKNLINQAKKQVVNLINKIKNQVQQQVRKAEQIVNKLVKEVQNKANRLVNKIKQSAKQVFDFAKQKAQNEANKVWKLAQKFVEIGNPKKAQDLIKKLQDFIGNTLNQAQQKITKLIAKLTTQVNQLLDRSIRRITQFMQNATAGIKKLVVSATTGAEKLLNKATHAAEDIIQKATQVNQMFQKAKSKLGGILGPARGVANWLIDQLTSAADGILRNVLQPLAKQAGNFIRNLLKPLLQSVASLIKQAIKFITDKISWITTKITQSSQWLLQIIKRLSEDYIEKVLKPGLDAVANLVKKVINTIIQKIADFILEPLKAFFEFLDLIQKILSKAGSVMDKILEHPVNFIKNLFSGMGEGLSGFGSRILQYLEKGLQMFLFGPIGEMGVKLPKSFDLKGLLSIVSQVAGISYGSIRKRASAKLGEDKVAFIEQGGEAVKTGKVKEFAQNQVEQQVNNQVESVQEQVGAIKQTSSLFVALREGAEGLINYFKQLDFKSLGTMVINGIKEYLIGEIVQKAIIQVSAYLVPGAGWLKGAVDALRVMYALFIKRAQQVKEIVEGFIDSVVDIAKSAVSQGAKRIETALGKSIPVLIGVLADYLGIGGLPDKIKSFIGKGQNWVNENLMPIIDKMIDWVASILPSLPEKKIGDYLPKGGAITQVGNNLYETVGNYITSKVEQPFESLEEAKGMVNQTFKLFEPMGLKALNLEPADESGKTFDIMATASPAKKAGTVKVKKISSPSTKIEFSEGSTIVGTVKPINFELKKKPEFRQNLDGISVDPALLQAVDILCFHLVSHNYADQPIYLGEGMRDAKKAHRWSTSYSIRNDLVPLSALRDLPEGKDLDGNQWYQEGWKEKKIKENAAKYGLSSPTTQAAEGYSKGDERRKPNTWPRGVSNHLFGKAVDVSIPWKTEKNGELNDPIANKIVKDFGLKRPVSKERWHFELL